MIFFIRTKENKNLAEVEIYTDDKGKFPVVSSKLHFKNVYNFCKEHDDEKYVDMFDEIEKMELKYANKVLSTKKFDYKSTVVSSYNNKLKELIKDDPNLKLVID